VATYSTAAKISKLIHSSATVRSETLLMCYRHLMHPWQQTSTCRPTQFNKWNVYSPHIITFNSTTEP